MRLSTPVLARQILRQYRRGGAASRPLMPDPVPHPGDDSLGDTLDQERREVLDAAIAILRSARRGPDLATAWRLLEHLAEQPDGPLPATSALRRSR